MKELIIGKDYEEILKQKFDVKEQYEQVMEEIQSIAKSYKRVIGKLSPEKTNALEHIKRIMIEEIDGHIKIRHKYSEDEKNGTLENEANYYTTFDWKKIEKEERRSTQGDRHIRYYNDCLQKVYDTFTIFGTKRMSPNCRKLVCEYIQKIKVLCDIMLIQNGETKIVNTTFTQKQPSEIREIMKLTEGQPIHVKTTIIETTQTTTQPSIQLQPKRKIIRRIIRKPIDQGVN